MLKALGPASWLHLHGKFEREQVTAVYKAVDIVVLPSICQESFGLVVAEALSAGRPVLSTRCGRPEDQIEDGVNGWLVEPNNPAAQSTLIRQLAVNPLTVEAVATNWIIIKTHDKYLGEIEKFFNFY